MRIGCQWKAVPKGYGGGSRIHAYFQEWTDAIAAMQRKEIGIENNDRYWVKEDCKKLPEGFQLGKTWKIPKAAVEEYIKQKVD